MVYLFIGLGFVFIYQSLAFFSEFHFQRYPNLLWAAAFAGFSGINTILFALMYDKSGVEPQIIGPWILTSSYCLFFCYVVTLKKYFFSAPPKIIQVLTYGLGLVAAVSIVGALLLLVGDTNLFFESIGDSGANEFLPYRERYKLSNFSHLSHLIDRILVFLALAVIAFRGKVYRDWVMFSGVMVSLILLSYNIISLNWFREYYFPIIPFINVVELMRFSWLNSRHRRLELTDLQRRVKQGEETLSRAGGLLTLGGQSAALLHEISTPLTVMKWGINKIKGRRANVHPDLMDSLDKINLANKQLSGLVHSARHNFLASDDQSKGRAEVREVCDSVFDLLEYRIRRHKVKVLRQGDGDQVVKCNPQQLSQVLINLINNACDAIRQEPDRWIKVKVFNSDGNTVISVSNSGEKIPDDISHRITEAFFTTKGCEGGTGLGLNICQRILQLHGGKLVLVKDGKFTEFEVHLPMAQ